MSDSLQPAAATPPAPPERWGGSLLLSALGHGALIGLIFFGARLFPHLFLGGQHPGGAGQGTIQANLVSSVPGGAIPMPSPTDTITKNRLANNNPGMAVSRPVRAPKPPPDAIRLPARRRHFTPKDLTMEQAQHELDRLARADVSKQPDNRADYGAGGPASFSYSMTPGVGGGGSLAFGDAAFGSQYAAWVNHLRDRLTFYWAQQYRDPAVPVGRLVYIQFTVDRSGHLSNVVFVERSNIPALDSMALHAVQQMAASETDPLPAGYPHSSLDVRVSFELQ